MIIFPFDHLGFNSQGVVDDPQTKFQVFSVKENEVTIGVEFTAENILSRIMSELNPDQAVGYPLIESAEARRQLAETESEATIEVEK